MIVYRCECGKAAYYGSGMVPAPCQGCSSCGTTYATSPDGHKPVGEHVWEPRYNSRTGVPDKRMCKRCYTTEKVPEQASDR